ncbi:MAG: galactokinase [bacterium]|nr:galactokinase [bacterium]
MNIELLNKTRSVFVERFGKEPEVSSKAPGRANIIGEHTDYNGGFVLPVGIDKCIYACGSKRTDSIIEIHSMDFDSDIVFRREELFKDNDNPWADYQKGVISEFIKEGYLPGGLNMVFGGDIPIGAGLSSSAAVELAAAVLINHLFEFNLDKMSLVKLCQNAERNFVGVQCGIMDQFASCMAQKDMAILLDCKTLDYEYSPFDMKDHKIVLCNTLKKRGLVDSEYNRRRAECEEGVAYFNEIKSGVELLRDIDQDVFNEYKEGLPENVRKRCEHVVYENHRVLECVRALKENDLKKTGSLLYGSHESLRDLYEVSCRELDIMVEIAERIKGNLGSRMMGAGFGGCTINIVETDSIDDFCGIMNEEYYKKTGIKPEIYISRIEDGAGIIE